MAGGAHLIDIKEPSNGPLGRADRSVWDTVAEGLPEGRPLSLALGELADFGDLPDIPDRVSYCKVGLAGVGRGWADDWRSIVNQSPRIGWVAVIYSDWQSAEAPPPDEVLDVAVSTPGCSAVLFDTYGKLGSNPLDLTWRHWIDRARSGGRKVALAGGLDLPRISQLRNLNPDWFAVRGAACQNGNRLGEIQVERVAELTKLLYTEQTF